MKTSNTILIFDDDQDILEIFRLILERAGHQVVTYSSTHNIIEKVKEAQPDLIIMDNWIPEMGGVTATQKLKEDATLSHIPVIFCSANNDIMLLARQAHADTYIAKPFDLNVLETTVASLLQANQKVD